MRKRKDTLVPIMPEGIPPPRARAEASRPG
jgi:hypothetical protein